MTSPKVQEVCERLYAAFRHAVPLPGEYAQTRKRKPSEADIRQKVEEGLARFYADAREERERHRFGIIGRARVAIGLQRRLLAAGYEAALVKQVLFAMLMSSFVGNGK